MHQHAVPVSVLSWCCASESERRAGLSVTGRRSRESLSAGPSWRPIMAKSKSIPTLTLSVSRDIPLNKLDTSNNP